MKQQKNDLLQTATNNDNINNDILPAPGYGDSSQQQPAKDAYNSALLNTNQQQQPAKTGGKDAIDNLSASLNYNNLADALNLDELNSIRSKVKRLASGYGTRTQQQANQEIENNKEQQRVSPYGEQAFRDNSVDALPFINNNLSANKFKPFNTNLKSPSSIRFKEKKRKFLQ